MLGDRAAVGVGDGASDGSDDVGGDTAGVVVAGATVIVGSGVDVAVTRGAVQVSANSAQTASSNGRFKGRSGPYVVWFEAQGEDPPSLAGLLVMQVEVSASSGSPARSARS